MDVLRFAYCLAGCCLLAISVAACSGSTSVAQEVDGEIRVSNSGKKHSVIIAEQKEIIRRQKEEIERQDREAQDLKRQQYHNESLRRFE